MPSHLEGEKIRDCGAETAARRFPCPSMRGRRRYGGMYGVQRIVRGFPLCLESSSIRAGYDGIFVSCGFPHKTRGSGEEWGRVERSKEGSNQNSHSPGR